MNKYKIELINVGRSKINKVKTLETNGGFDVAYMSAYRECKKHLVSTGVDLDETDTKGIFTVSAGFHTVGKVKISLIK